MGGHGALICALKCQGQYKSVSAFAPISNAINSGWGQRAFTGYLGEKNSNIHWNHWDATELTKTYNGPPLDILIDQVIIIIIIILYTFLIFLIDYLKFNNA